MTPCDPMAVAVDWLDAYRAARINQIVGMHSPDAVIECACGGRKTIYGQEGYRGLLATSLHRKTCDMDGGAVVISYRTSSGIVQALLDIAEDGLITRCRCGPI